MFTTVAGILAGTCLLLALAGYVDSKRRLEALADFRPLQLVADGAVLALALALVVRSRGRRGAVVVVAVMALGSVAINAWEVAPWLGNKARSVKPPGAEFTRLKFIAFNVGSRNTEYAATRDFVLEASPDLVMFCESYDRWPEELAALTSLLPHHVRVDSMAIEIFSRLPLAHTRIFTYGAERGFVAVTVGDGPRLLTFTAVHTYSRSWRGAIGFAQRTAALKEGLVEQARTPGPHVMMGDFNATPWSPAFKYLIRTSGLRDPRRTFGLLPTEHGDGFISRWLWRPLDHCLHSAGIVALDLQCGPDLGSDHRPLIAELAVPPPAAAASLRP